MPRRVLSYPPAHPYVDRLDHPDVADLVHREQPWPLLPDFYDPTWLQAHGGNWDVAHFHFTWEQHEPDTFEAVLRQHRDDGTPIVWTAHDLRNPHLADAARHEDYLTLLAEGADEVVTLTAGAATAIAERYGRHPDVIPHGPLVPPDRARRLREAAQRATGGPTDVLLLAKGLRANLDWRAGIEVASTLAGQGVPIELTVHLHHDAPAKDDILSYAGSGGVSIEVGDRMGTPELWRRLAVADVLLLPYRWGTHSGLVELATDLGTQPVVSDVGYVLQQVPAHLVRTDGDAVDRDHLAEVLRAIAVLGVHVDPTPLAFRERTLEEFLTYHATLYRRL